MNYDHLKNFNAGVTVSSPVLPSYNVTSDPHTTISLINQYVEGISRDFLDVLRFNQKNQRYEFIGTMITKPPGSIYKYTTIGLFYKDLKHKLNKQTSIQLKQDFVLFDPSKESFIFVIEKKGWYSLFPKLRNHDQHIWNWKPDFSTYVNGAHYYDKGRKNFDHHYPSIDVLPDGIKPAI